MDAQVGVLLICSGADRSYVANGARRARSHRRAVSRLTQSVLAPVSQRHVVALLPVCARSIGSHVPIIARNLIFRTLISQI